LFLYSMVSSITAHDELWSTTLLLNLGADTLAPLGFVSLKWRKTAIIGMLGCVVAIEFLLRLPSALPIFRDHHSQWFISLALPLVCSAVLLSLLEAWQVIRSER
jgi:hypothetical protein